MRDGDEQEVKVLIVRFTLPKPGILCICACRCFCEYLQVTEEPSLSCGLRAKLLVCPTELAVSPIHTFQLPLRRLDRVQKLRLLLDRKKRQNTTMDTDENQLP